MQRKPHAQRDWRDINAGGRGIETLPPAFQLVQPDACPRVPAKVLNCTPIASQRSYPPGGVGATDAWDP